MSRMRGIGMVAALAVVLAGAVGTARADVLVVPPRPGQIGIGLDGMYGFMPSTGTLGELFGSGPGFGVHLRYRMRYERGFGLSFESHGFDVRSLDSFPDPFLGPVNPDTSIAGKRLSLFLYGVDFYQMFGTRTKTTRMLSVSAGIAHPQITLNDNETTYRDDGLYAGVGAGLEHFFYQSLGYELSARYHAVFLDGRVNHDFQAEVGLIFYASL